MLLYGHLDKQPEMTGWREGLGPWNPVIDGDRLYGRGGADDGYAAFAVAPRHRGRRARRPPARPLRGAHRGQRGERQPRPAGTPRRAGRSHRAAGARGLPRLRVRSTPSGCGSPRRCAGWSAAVVTVQVLDEGVHSGDASGVVPSSFRIVRQLLDRIEDATTGRVLLDALHVDVPTDRLDEAAAHGGRADPSARRGLPVRRVDPADGRRPRRAAARPDVATDGQLRRRRRIPADRPGRQRAAPVDVAVAQRPPAADVRPGRGRVGARRGADARSAVGRHGHATAAAPRHRDGTRRRSRRGCGRRSTTRRRRLRQAGAGVRRGRHDPVHGHARGDVPRRPVRHHRRARCRAATPTGRTSSSTCRRRGASASASPVCSAPTPDPDRSPRQSRAGPEDHALRSLDQVGSCP